ncbi:MAG TPA: alcohol dehydrogenase catalytic domain-containing protein [Nitrososphaera sp.]
MHPDTMKAAVFYGPGRITVQERAVPDNGSSLLKVTSCTVCGYDVRVFQDGHGKVRPPVILGHEICGETLEGLPSIAPGTRVAVYPILPCLHCGYCGRGQYNLCANRKEIGSTIDGGFAEYVAVPEEIVKVGGLVPIPDSVTSEEAALIEPLACCLNGFTQLGTIKPEHTVAVIGDGPIGLIHLQLSTNLFGAKTVVVGCNGQRMRMAELLGAHAVFDARQAGADDVLQAAGETGFDVVVIAASDPAATELAFKIAGRGSRVSLFAGRNAAKLDYGTLHYNQVSVIGSFSSLPRDLREAARIAGERKVVELSKMITHRFGLDQIHEALSATANYHGLRVAVSAR